MWDILAEKTIAVVICRFDGSTVQHGLVLDLGDLVEITQQCQDWYLGSNLSSTGSKGIFPKSYVAKTRSLPDPDRWSLYDDPVVEEATNVIREWVVIWRQYYLKRQAERYSALRTAISELIDWRRQLMTGTFTHDHLRDMRLRITTHIDRGNRKLGLDLVPRVENRIVGPDCLGVYELYIVHVASAARNPNVTFPSVSISFHQLVAHIYLLVGCVFHMSSLIESNGRWHSR